MRDFTGPSSSFNIPVVIFPRYRLQELSKIYTVNEGFFHLHVMDGYAIGKTKNKPIKREGGTVTSRDTFVSVRDRTSDEIRLVYLTTDFSSSPIV